MRGPRPAMRRLAQLGGRLALPEDVDLGRQRAAGASNLPSRVRSGRLPRARREFWDGDRGLTPPARRLRASFVFAMALLFSANRPEHYPVRFGVARRRCPWAAGSCAKVAERESDSLTANGSTKRDNMPPQYIMTIENLSKAYAKKEVLQNIWLSFYPAAKIGVIGGNGSGKSTLLRIMAGIETDFIGSVRHANGITIGYLPQEPMLDPDLDVRGNVETAVAPIRAL